MKHALVAIAGCGFVSAVVSAHGSGDAITRIQANSPDFRHHRPTVSGTATLDRSMVVDLPRTPFRLPAVTVIRGVPPDAVVALLS